MKIQSRPMLRLVGRTGAAVIRALLATCKVRECIEAPDWHPFMGGAERNCLFTTWHENIVPASWYSGRTPAFHTLASPSRDGELIASCASSLGLTLLRGSSYDGGVRALKQIVDAAKSRKRFRFGFTPDGPRGPRRQMQPGAAYVASRSGLPVLPLGIACENPWRLRSWDCLQIPKPFGRIQIYLGAPFWAPVKLDRSGMEAFARRLEGDLHRAQSLAEELLKEPIVSERRRIAAPRRAA